MGNGYYYDLAKIFGDALSHADANDLKLKSIEIKDDHVETYNEDENGWVEMRWYFFIQPAGIAKEIAEEMNNGRK